MNGETITKITNYITIGEKFRSPGFHFLRGKNILNPSSLEPSRHTSIDVRPMNEDINIMSRMVSEISGCKSDEEKTADLRCGIPIREYAKFGLLSITLAEYFSWRGRIAMDSMDSSACGFEYPILCDFFTETGPWSWFLMKALRYIESLRRSRDKLYERIVSPAVRSMAVLGLAAHIKTEFHMIRSRLLALSGGCAAKTLGRVPISHDLRHARLLLRGRESSGDFRLVFNVKPSFCLPLPGDNPFSSCTVKGKNDAVDVIGQPISRMVRGGFEAVFTPPQAPPQTPPQAPPQAVLTPQIPPQVVIASQVVPTSEIITPQVVPTPEIITSQAVSWMESELTDDDGPPVAP